MDSGPWGISIRTPKKKIMKVVSREEDESLRECLDRTKSYAKLIRAKYADRDDIVIEIVSRQKAFPKPANVQIPRTHLWCPYCVKPRRFKTSQIVEIDGVTYASNYKRCEVCGMSDNDWYVKTENNLWPDYQDALRQAARKEAARGKNR